MRVLLVLLLLSGSVYANNNNNVVQTCISVYDTWSDRSRCYHDWKTEDNRRKYAEQREYTDMRPWYYGRNWRWEDRSEYTCERIYNNKIMNTITVCSKPVYIN